MEDLIAYRKLLVDRFEAQAGELQEAVSRIQVGKVDGAVMAHAWTPRMVLSSVRDYERDISLPGIIALLQGKESGLGRLDVQDRVGGDTSEESVASIVGEFRQARLEGSRLLKNAKVTDWNRTARHPKHGMRTLQWWVEQAVARVAEQIHQLERFVARP